MLADPGQDIARERRTARRQQDDVEVPPGERIRSLARGLAGTDELDALVAAEALEHLGKPLAASDHADTEISLALGHRVGVLPSQSWTYWFSRMPSPRTDWSVSTLFVLSAASITGRSVSDHCAFFITQYSF